MTIFSLRFIWGEPMSRLTGHKQRYNHTCERRSRREDAFADFQKPRRRFDVVWRHASAVSYIEFSSTLSIRKRHAQRERGLTRQIRQASPHSYENSPSSTRPISTHERVETVLPTACLARAGSYAYAHAAGRTARHLFRITAAPCPKAHAPLKTIRTSSQLQLLRRACWST